MKLFYKFLFMAVFSTTYLSAQQVQAYSISSPSSQVVTTTQVDPNAPTQDATTTTTTTGTNPAAPTIIVLPAGATTVPGMPGVATTATPAGYQYQNGVQLGVPLQTPVNPYAQDYSYGQSSVQYANPVVPIKPYVPYSDLTPPQNAYPLYPYTSPEANQVNQQFMQRYSQQDQDFIRSQFGYPQTFIDPNAGKPPLGKPIRYSDPNSISANRNKKGIKDSKMSLKPRPLVKIPDSATFFFPGMVALSKRLWVGSDYLFYVPSNIGVVIELIADKQIRSDEGEVLLNEIKIKKGVEGIFSKNGIAPQSYSVENKAPVPFFHILIMMYHVDNKIFASISGRLFEEAMPARLDLDAPVGTFQAITWEKNEILISSLLQAPEQIELMVNDIANTFINSYRYFAEETLDMTSPDDLREDDY